MTTVPCTAPLRLTTRQRVGWVLRVNRLGSAQHRLTRLTAFAGEFGAGCCGPVSVSTLSRWENGVTTIPQWAVTRYEEVLGLPPGMVPATADTVCRYHVPPTDRPPQWVRHREPLTGAAVEEPLDRAIHGGEMTGADWDQLSGAVAACPDLVLTPASTWTALTERLLVEMSIADGVSWMMRSEAYHRLIAHDTGRGPAIATAMSAVVDRSAQSMIGSISVLNASSHPDASRAVLDQVRDPTTSRTFYGALLTSAKKLRYGHLTGEQCTALLPYLLDLLDHGSWEQAGLAARLLQFLPVSLRSRLPRRVLDQLGHQLTDAADPLSVALIREVSGELAAAGLPEDPVLPSILSEMLHHPVFDVRLCATFQVYATPYRPLVAAAAARAALATLQHGGNRHHLERLLESLRVLGGPSERRLIERLLLGGDTAPAVRDMAAYALGHVGGRSTDAFLHRATTATTRRWSRCGDPREASVLDRLVYASGIGGQRKVLLSVERTPEVPARVRSAARWWLGIPPYLIASAQL